MMFLLSYLFGIIMGLYLNGIVLILCIVLLMVIIMRARKTKCIMIIISIIIVVIGFVRMNYEKNKYKYLENLEEYKGNGVVMEVERSTQYKNLYLVKEDKLFLKLYTSKKVILDYGDIISFRGDFSLPEEARNEYGFNNKNYLRQKKIGGYVFSDDINIKGQNKLYHMFSVKKFIKNSLRKNFSNEAYGFINGIFLADSSEIDEEVKENFQKANLLHILAVSGMHINIIENILSTILEKIKLHKKKAKMIIIFLLFTYMIIIGSPVSCMRAVLMESLDCIAFILDKKPNFKNSVIVSLMIICFINPYNILNVGMWLSYGGTIGIVYTSKFFTKKISKIFKRTNIITRFLSENMAVSLSVQLFIFPIIVYYFNNISISCIISNLIVTPLITPLVYLILFSIVFHFFTPVNFLISFFYKEIAFVSKLDFYSIYIARPALLLIIVYYTVLFVIVFRLKDSFINNYRHLFKIKNRLLITIIIFLFIYNSFYLIPRNYLEYDFIDVGQGDCSLIITPNRRSIVIDGGDNTDYDNGTKTVLPILINKHIKQIDYLIISHFDSDHVGGLLSVLREYKVKRVIISKQAELSNNFEEFMKIIKNKKIEIILVSQGNRISIEKNVYIDILWPDENSIIIENCLNNNSIVCKLNYGEISILFTGDIEEEAENRIVSSCKTALNSNIIKVPHHGSNSSSTEGFVEAISPKIVLIGVGKNNKFGHPNDEIIERYENMRSKDISHRSNGGDIVKDKLPRKNKNKVIFKMRDMLNLY